MAQLLETFSGIKQSKYWPYLKWGGAALLLILAFLFGRNTATIDKVVEFKEKIVYQDRIVEKVVTVERKAEDKIRIVYRETKPDGTKTEREEERTKTDTEKKENKDSVREVIVEKEVIKKETTVSQPRFYLGASVGYDMSPRLLPIPTAPNLSLGLEFKVRLIGPIWAGAYAQNTGNFGGTLGVTF